jgi:hypothetical protein
MKYTLPLHIEKSIYSIINILSIPIEILVFKALRNLDKAENYNIFACQKISFGIKVEKEIYLLIFEHSYAKQEEAYVIIENLLFEELIHFLKEYE